jgi:hypothetical protein
MRFTQTFPRNENLFALLLTLAALLLIFALMRFMAFFNAGFAVSALVIYLYLNYRQPAMLVIGVIFYGLEALSMVDTANFMTLPGALKLRDVVYLSPLIGMLPVGFRRKEKWRRVFQDPISKIFLLLSLNALLATVINGLVYGGDVFVGIRQTRDFIMPLLVYFYLVFYIETKRDLGLLRQSMLFFALFATAVMYVTTFVDPVLLEFASAAKKMYEFEGVGAIVTKIYYQSQLLIFPLYFILFSSLILKPKLTTGIATIILFIACISSSSRGVLFALVFCSTAVLFSILRTRGVLSSFRKMTQAIALISFIVIGAVQTQFLQDFINDYVIVGKTGLHEVSTMSGNFSHRLKTIQDGVEAAMLYNPLTGTGMVAPGSEIDTYVRRTQWQGSIGGETSYGPIIGKMGLIGLILYIALFIKIFRVVKTSALRMPTYAYGLLGFSSFMLLIGFLGNTLVNNYGLIIISTFVFITKYTSPIQHANQKAYPRQKNLI